MSGRIELERRADGVATLWIDNLDHRNALNNTLIAGNFRGTGTTRDLKPSVLEFPRENASAISSIGSLASAASASARGGVCHSRLSFLNSRVTSISCVQSRSPKVRLLPSTK